MSRSRKLFVNLAVRDLERSQAFFARLGFGFDPRFTDEKAACMILSDEAFVMLLAEPYFKTFTRREPCDLSRQTEGLFCFSCESRAEVDQLVKLAVENGGKHAMEPQDHGFMYGWSFYDPDGHHWEVMWMDPAALEAPPEA
jgi:predicted lactoylglutathione lyase